MKSKSALNISHVAIILMSLLAIGISIHNFLSENIIRDETSTYIENVERVNDKCFAYTDSSGKVKIYDLYGLNTTFSNIVDNTLVMGSDYTATLEPTYDINFFNRESKLIMYTHPPYSNLVFTTNSHLYTIEIEGNCTTNRYIIKDNKIELL